MLDLKHHIKDFSAYITYCQIISDNLKTRSVIGVTEKHHIIPKSLGGEDFENNIVNLTCYDHFVAHYYLDRCLMLKKTFDTILIMNSFKPIKNLYEVDIQNFVKRRKNRCKK